jgi:hypothetical protein
MVDAEIVGKYSSNFEFVINGQNTTIHKWREGSPIFVYFYTFWWSSCGPSSKQVEAMQNNTDYSGLIKFLLINIDDDGR